MPAQARTCLLRDNPDLGDRKLRLAHQDRPDGNLHGKVKDVMRGVLLLFLGGKLDIPRPHPDRLPFIRRVNVMTIPPALRDLRDVATPLLLLGACTTMRTGIVVVVQATTFEEAIDLAELPGIRVLGILQQRRIAFV